MGWNCFKLTEMENCGYAGGTAASDGCGTGDDRSLVHGYAMIVEMLVAIIPPCDCGFVVVMKYLMIPLIW